MPSWPFLSSPQTNTSVYSINAVVLDKARTLTIDSGWRHMLVRLSFGLLMNWVFALGLVLVLRVGLRHLLAGTICLQVRLRLSNCL